MLAPDPTLEIPWPAGSWRRSLARAIRDPAELLRTLSLDPEQVFGTDCDLAGTLEAVGRSFPLRVPREFVTRMEPGEPDDPLLRQVLNDPRELEGSRGYGLDPLAEQPLLAPGQGVLRKYRGRALLLVTGACAVHCRYCFRRHFPYAEHRVSQDLDRALAELAADPEVDEVLLSGGDPLALGDEVLAPLSRRLAELGSVARLRIHTRTPIVLPQRVDAELLRWIEEWPGQAVVVVHANHARELDHEVAVAMKLLRSVGATVLNQSVLLAGINDTVEALGELSLRLFEIGVLPYYLHLLDPVAGAEHFDLEIERARGLERGLRERLPGYLVPKFVREVPGELSKTPLCDV